jgi:hypothetical protein
VQFGNLRLAINLQGRPGSWAFLAGTITLARSALVSLRTPQKSSLKSKKHVLLGRLCACVRRRRKPMGISGTERPRGASAPDARRALPIFRLPENHSKTELHRTRPPRDGFSGGCRRRTFRPLARWKRPPSPHTPRRRIAVGAGTRPRGAPRGVWGCMPWEHPAQPVPRGRQGAPGMIAVGLRAAGTGCLAAGAHHVGVIPPHEQQHRGCAHGNIDNCCQVHCVLRVPGYPRLGKSERHGCGPMQSTWAQRGTAMVDTLLRLMLG